jgi:hypothetical protein
MDFRVKARRTFSLLSIGVSILGIVAGMAGVFRIMTAGPSANDDSALGDMRTVASAEGGYSFANGGYYDTLRCVAEPWTCIPGYPAGQRIEGGDGWIDESYASLAIKGHYKREFHAGPPVSADEIREKHLSPTSVTAFAYTAAPARLSCDGSRGFCVDSGGAVCDTRDGSMPKTIEGRCDPATCRPLR